MKRWSATLLVCAVCSAVVHADVTIVQKTTVEGAESMAPGDRPSPATTTRIKGSKGRIDKDSDAAASTASVSTMTDAAARQVIVLDHNQKTARVSSAAPVAPTATMKIDGAVTPTGKSQTIDGLKCDEHPGEKPRTGLSNVTRCA
jgi:hypothetical protein